MIELNLVRVSFVETRVFNGGRLPETIHVQLANEAGHVVVFEVKRKEFLRKP